MPREGILAEDIFPNNLLIVEPSFVQNAYNVSRNWLVKNVLLLQSRAGSLQNGTITVKLPMSVVVCMIFISKALKFS